MGGRTIRQIVHVHAGGQQLRLRVSNRYGNKPISLTSISVGRVLRGSKVREISAVTFRGEQTVTLPAGQEEATSDPITTDSSSVVDAFTNLAITFYLYPLPGDTASVTGHPEALQTSYVSAPSPPPPAAAAAVDFSSVTRSWWLITGVDILPVPSSSTPSAIVALGSSTTDGVGSSINANKRWPDCLARRLRRQSRDGNRFLSVLNAGLSGNQLTRDFGSGASNATLPVRFPFGEAGKTRLAWDVLAQPGLSAFIIHLGSNDLRTGVPASALIQAYIDLSHRVRSSSSGPVRVFGTTVLPGAYTPEQARERRLFNTWMLQQSTHSDYFHGVFDLSTPLQHPANDALIHPLYDSGDGMHPNDDGYRLIANAVDIGLLAGTGPSVVGSVPSSSSRETLCLPHRCVAI